MRGRQSDFYGRATFCTVACAILYVALSASYQVSASELSSRVDKQENEAQGLLVLFENDKEICDEIAKSITQPYLQSSRSLKDTYADGVPKLYPSYAPETPSQAKALVFGGPNFMHWARIRSSIGPHDINPPFGTPLTRPTWTGAEFLNNGRRYLVTQDHAVPITWNVDLNRTAHSDWGDADVYRDLERLSGPAMGDCHRPADPISQPQYYVGGEHNRDGQLCSVDDIRHSSSPHPVATILGRGQGKDKDYGYADMSIHFFQIDNRTFTIFLSVAQKLFSTLAVADVRVVKFESANYHDVCEFAQR